MDEQSEQPRKFSRRKILRAGVGGVITVIQEPLVNFNPREHVRKYLELGKTGFRPASEEELFPYLTRESLSGTLAIEVPRNFNFISEIKNIHMQYYNDCVPASVAHLSSWLFADGSKIFSPLFHYWFRKREGDNGATYPKIFDAWTGYGNATVDIVPYGPGLNIDGKPTNEQLAKTVAYKINQNDIISVYSDYQRLPTIDEFSKILSQYGPILMSVKADSEEWDIWNEDKIIGKPEGSVTIFPHSVLAVGVNMDQGYIDFANSWGKDWGMNGFGKISLDCYDGGTFTEMWAVNSQAIKGKQRLITPKGYLPLLVNDRGFR